MKNKHFVGQVNNSCNSVIAEFDNRLYIWVPTIGRKNEEPIFVSEEEVDQYSGNLYEALWLFWDKRDRNHPV